ncbi:Retrotransposon protein, putative [Theobroma cacao]|uniref:Retrotransposon protein, putative n=1 Tax=Theobroma cacao TaxID=3641 RepID=A0A061FVT5_THECC|nr:Retrotransposon protein, putative [Theobroma cacao]
MLIIIIIDFVVLFLNKYLLLGVINIYFMARLGLRRNLNRRKRIVATRRVRSYNLDFYANREYVMRLVHDNDFSCIAQVRMNKHTFVKLCEMLENIGGLKSTRNMLVDEQVAIFLYIIAHHLKSQVIRQKFKRSSKTISRHFNKVLNAVMKLQDHLLRKPKPIPTNSTDNWWKWFKNCLGALDGTYIEVKEGHQPTTLEEFFNMKHVAARNVIERCFGLLKIRWAILRSPSFYPIKIHNRIIIACCLLHNFIRREMTFDLIEDEVGEYLHDNTTPEEEDVIGAINPTDAWTNWRMQLANEIFTEWQTSRQNQN